jgi:hypothetical protein
MGILRCVRELIGDSNQCTKLTVSPLLDHRGAIVRSVRWCLHLAAPDEIFLESACVVGASHP